VRPINQLKPPPRPEAAGRNLRGFHQRALGRGPRDGLECGARALMMRRGSSPIARAVTSRLRWRPQVVEHKLVQPATTRMKKHGDAALVQFERWMRLRGVQWDETALHIRPCHKKGERLHYAVFAGDTLAVDLPVITIPKVTRRITSLAGQVSCVG
jgi:hypothetical protein